MNKFLLKIAAVFMAFNYGISVCMLRKVEKRTEKTVRRLNLNKLSFPQSVLPQVKDANDFCAEIPRDNFFSRMPRELRLKCCPEGESVWVNATMRTALSDSITSFQWHMRLEDRKNLSSTCKSLREIMWVEDVNFRNHIQKNKERYPMPVPVIKISYERGLEEGLNSLPSMEYNPTASLEDKQAQACILQ